ncbi:hypothetical protein [Shimia sediminis]|uniref:hypothetical protein n=1 Tax=Shimia sediminis TaxID=2497945 RepID=UPI000F8C35FB|nr:hypothetical protein [Shimia sediminis]
MTRKLPIDDEMPAFLTYLEDKLAASGIASVTFGAVILNGRDHVAILVDDDDAEAAKLVARKSGASKVHFLTSSGRKGGSFRLEDPRYHAISMAVLPVRIAQELLKHAGDNGGVNALMRHQLAIYVKTYFGSVARLVGLSVESCDEREITNSDDNVGLVPSLGTDRTSQDRYLASIGWQPPVDMLERLGLTDPWIAEELLPSLTQYRDVPPGLAVFFCRKHAIELGFFETIRNSIEAKGYKILFSTPLEGEIARKLRDSTRGGNWGAGPFPVSGGPPVHLIFAVDVFPVKPARSLLGQHPFLDNETSLSTKNFARDNVLSTLPSSQHFNPLHSSDNSAEALHLAEMVLPKNEFKSLSDEFFSSSGRASELIGDGRLLWNTTPISASFWVEEQGEVRLRKVFRPQFAECLDNVARLHEALSDDWPEIPAVIDQQDGYLDLAVSDISMEPLGSATELPRLATILRLRKVLKAVKSAGFAPVAWNPECDICLSSEHAGSMIVGFDKLETSESEQIIGTTPSSLHRQALQQSYNTQWTKQLGVPKIIVVNGHTATIAMFRIVISPSVRVVERFADFCKKTYRRTRSRAKSLLRR